VFIIVMIVLAVLVFFGIRAVQQRGEQARNDQATEIARQNQEESTPTIAEESPAPEQTSTNEEDAPIIPAPTTPSPDVLPETGVESILPILLLGAATYVTTRVIRDRQLAA
jgi:cytoskeletal protein RodZ